MFTSNGLLVFCRKLMMGPMNDPEAPPKEPREGGNELLRSAKDVAVEKPVENLDDDRLEIRWYES